MEFKKTVPTILHAGQQGRHRLVMFFIKSYNFKINAGEGGEKREPSYTVSGNEN